VSSLRRLVVFGDSFVEGYYNSKEEGRGLIRNNFVHHLGELLGVEVLSHGKNGSSNLAISNQVMTHIRNTDKETLQNDAFLVVFSEWNRLTIRSMLHDSEHPNVLEGRTPDHIHRSNNILWGDAKYGYKSYLDEAIQRAETENSYLAVSHICQKMNIPYRMINSFCYQSYLDTVTIWENGQRLGRKDWSMISPQGDPNWIETDSLYNTLHDICAERWVKTGDKPPMVDYLKHTKVTSDKKNFMGCMHPNEKGHRLIAETLSPYITQILKD